MKWNGVMPAITTNFDSRYQVDLAFMTNHSRWLVQNRCSGVVALGSLGEGATLSFEEKEKILEACVRGLEGRAPVVAAISALTTQEAVRLAVSAEKMGCDGVMVLPPYVYRGDWVEMKAHVSSVFHATRLPCMLYNNPIAYGTDFLPEQIHELAEEHENLRAVKESSGDLRRVCAIKALVGDRLDVLVGVDDAILEGLGAGASGWIAGLADALPAESVDLFEYCLRGEREKAFALYRWFLPLLRLDTVPKFVQLIKLVQREAGIGNSRVRPPRLELAGIELEDALTLIRKTLKTRPARASLQLDVPKR